MQPRLSPLHSARRYTYSDDDCLYRDHFGRRVVADLEAGGFAWIETSNCPVQGYPDETEQSTSPWSFDQNLAVVASAPGAVHVEVQSPELRAAVSQLDLNQAVSVRLPYVGTGYLLAFDGEVVVDQNQVVTGGTSPIPFFFSLSGSGSARVIESSTALELIDILTIDDVPGLKARGYEVQNQSKLSTLDSCLPDGTRRMAAVASHLNAASWWMKLPPPEDDFGGLLLVRTYDRFHGRQRARVLVDDRFLGYWYEPGQDRRCRWHQSNFGIPAEALRGKSEVKITIDPPPGSPLWSISRMEAYALLDG
jgi:hypothetical protein